MYLRLAGFALLFLVCLLLFIWHKSRCLCLPPGPPRLPLIGNLHQISDDYQQNTFSEWGRKYGDVVYARILANDVLIVNSATAARVLMEKRGAKYSGRPLFTFLCELGGFSWNLAFMPNTDRWKRHRKWFQHGFQVKRRLDEYIPIQQRETRRILSDLLVEPDAYMSHIKRFAAATMLEIGYGHTVTSLDDDYIHMIDSAIEGMVLAGNPGSMIVDFFPPLKYVPAWLPGLTWKKTVIRLRPVVDLMNLSPFRAVVKAINEGSVKSSFASAILDEVAPDVPLSPAEEREISGAVGSVYTAGTETTVSTLSAWLLAMVRHPEVYKKAQAEIDMVIGAGRLPELNDRDSLPFLECILKEVYRWGVPVPLSIPHQLTEEDTYNGYDMPLGALIIPNLWAMSRDEKMYDAPDEFKPERFLNLEPDVTERLDPRKYVFGHGRRICPGRFLGDSSIWLVMAGITATFDICKVRDSNGREITPPPDFLSGFVRHPTPFSCVIRPRSEKSAELVSQAFQEGSI